MALVFLDTNTCIYFMKGRFPALRRRLLQTRPEDVRIPSVVAAELLFGLEKIGAPDAARSVLRDFLAPFDRSPFDSAAALHYARIRAILERAGTPIGPNDLMIASIVMAHGGTLVTKNVDEFSRVPGLPVEDWTRE